MASVLEEEESASESSVSAELPAGTLYYGKDKHMM